MKNARPPIDESRAVAHLLDLLRLEGLGGQERRVAQRLRAKLVEAGCPPETIRFDDAAERLGPGFETGNLIVCLPGTLPAPRILFSAHMDVVPLCRNAEPILRGERIVSAGKTGLGGDDRTGCAAMVVLAETLLRNDLPHPPLVLLFLVAEEGGLHGSRMVRPEDLDHPVMGFNLDGQTPDEVVVGAMGAVRWTATLHGRSSHAGLAPEQGVSAGLAGSMAVAEIAERGYFGKIEIDGRRGTSNLGRIEGGEASNQVMDLALFSGECRSHDPAFLEEIVRVHREAFEGAARRVRNVRGRCASLQFDVVSDYRAFRLADAEPCVRLAGEALRATGLPPRPVVMDAGLDANNLNEKGIPTVTLGTGTHEFHTIDEFVAVPEYLACCANLLHVVRLAPGFE